MNAQLTITLVGGDIQSAAEAVFDAHRLTMVNPVKEGRLGNLKLLTYVFAIPEAEVIPIRKAVMGAFADEWHLTPMYPYGNYMHLYIFGRIRV